MLNVIKTGIIKNNVDNDPFCEKKRLIHFLLLRNLACLLSMLIRTLFRMKNTEKEKSNRQKTQERLNATGKHYIKKSRYMTIQFEF